MAGRNCTQVTEFILKGFTNHPGFQGLLFVVFLVIYVITILGNLGMITLVRIEPRLHTPMYYFLSHLAFVDLCYSSVIAPKMLADLLAERKTISYSACAAQLCVFCMLIVTECFLLAAMAYDRYVAICHPLLYRVVMCPRRCSQLMGGFLLFGCVNSVVQTTGMLTLTFCDSNVIDLFFCDISPLLSLVSSDSRVNHAVLLAVTYLTGVLSGLVVLISYIFILNAILRIRSAEGQLKAFSTCASHLTAVTIFYGTGLFIYLQPSTKYSRDQDKVVSVFYTVVTPMLNPLIYGLRNKKVKATLRRSIERKTLSLGLTAWPEAMSSRG